MQKFEKLGLWGKPLYYFAMNVWVGGMGAYGLSYVQMPLNIMIGATLFTMITVIFFKIPVYFPGWFRKSYIFFVGLQLGVWFSPVFLQDFWLWLPSFFVLLFVLSVYTIFGTIMGVKIARMDVATAYFSSIPGGVTEVLLLAEGYKFDHSKVVFIQLIRITGIVLLIPVLFRLLGFSVDQVIFFSEFDTFWSMKEFFMLWLGGSGLAMILYVMKIPGIPLLSGVCASAFFYIHGDIESAPPQFLPYILQACVGAGIGCQFFGVKAKFFGRPLIFALLMMVSLIVMCLGMSWIFYKFLGYGYADIVFSYLPGGMSEIIFAATLLEISPIFIATHHLLRLLLIIFLLPLCIRVLKYIFGNAIFPRNTGREQ